MTKTVKCRDVGFDCDGVVRAQSEDELLKLVAEHASQAHGVQQITPQIVAKVKSVIKEE